MAQKVEIKAIPNQKLLLPIGELTYGIHIYAIGASVCYDLTVNDVELIRGFKLINQTLLLPYKYQEVDGNLIMRIPSGELADYERFGESQFLFHLTEIEADLYRELYL